MNQAINNIKRKTTVLHNVILRDFEVKGHIFISFVEVGRFQILVEPEVKHLEIESSVVVRDVEIVRQPSHRYRIFTQTNIDFSGFVIVSYLALEKFHIFKFKF